MPRPLPPTLGASLMGQPTLGVRRGKSSKKKRLITLSPSFFSPIEGHSLGHGRHVGRAERKHKGKGFKCPASLSTSLMATTLQRFCHLSSRWPLPLKLEGVSNIKAKWGDLNDNKERGRSEIPMEGAFHCVQCVFRHDESSKVFNLNSF